MNVSVGIEDHCMKGLYVIFGHRFRSAEGLWVCYSVGRKCQSHVQARGLTCLPIDSFFMTHQHKASVRGSRGGQYCIRGTSSGFQAGCFASLLTFYNISGR